MLIVRTTGPVRVSTTLMVVLFWTTSGFSLIGWVFIFFAFMGDIATYGGGLEVIDVKVVKMDGTRSRLISTIGESAKYESASAAAASFFDSILDTLCFNDPIRLENWRGQPRLLDCSEYILEVFGQERCVRR